MCKLILYAFIAQAEFELWSPSPLLYAGFGADSVSTSSLPNLFPYQGSVGMDDNILRTETLKSDSVLKFYGVTSVSSTHSLSKQPPCKFSFCLYHGIFSIIFLSHFLLISCFLHTCMEKGLAFNALSPSRDTFSDSCNVQLFSPSHLSPNSHCSSCQDSCV